MTRAEMPRMRKHYGAIFEWTATIMFHGALAAFVIWLGSGGCVGQAYLENTPTHTITVSGTPPDDRDAGE